MLSRIRKSIDEKEQGFTLTELLVVIIIIGILAAIAIPVFLNQQKKGVDASMKSDVKNAAAIAEAWVAANPGTALTTNITWATDTVPGVGALVGTKVSHGNYVLLDISAATPGAYCIYAMNPGASTAIGAGLTKVMAYYSIGGGLQPATVPVGCA